MEERNVFIASFNRRCFNRKRVISVATHKKINKNNIKEIISTLFNISKNNIVFKNTTSNSNFMFKGIIKKDNFEDIQFNIEDGCFYEW